MYLIIICLDHSEPPDVYTAKEITPDIKKGHEEGFLTIVQLGSIPTMSVDGAWIKIEEIKQ